MKEYHLNYYSKFKCIAGECKHTCCKGWDTYIDERTLNEYKNQTLPFKKSLEKGINFKKARFKKDRSGRCAFLNGDGLCEIIINLGEQSLCQICNDHPRFKNFFNGQIETGLGFACERATAIILACEEKIEPMLISADNDAISPSFVQERLLNFRQTALDIIQDRKVAINQRIANLLSLCNAEICESDYKKIIKRFISFERLDKGWGERLKKLSKANFLCQTDERLALYCEHFLANCFYRHLNESADVVLGRAVVVACVFAWWIINNVYVREQCENNRFESLCDIVRAFSAEVEYSQENLSKLFIFAEKFVNV